jgi:LAO/AO transport system kinase
VEALDAHRAGLDVAARRTAARRAGALADFIVEHGHRGLRAVGGRRSAVTLLAAQDPGADVPSLLATLEARLGTEAT